MKRDRQISVKLEKSPKDPLDELEPKMSTEEKVKLVKELGTFAATLYFFKVGTDAMFTIIVNAAAKGLK